MVEIIFLILGCLLLLYAGFYDFRHKMVESWLVGLLLFVGGLYLAFNQNFVDTMAVVFFTLVIWGMPTLFGFGLGDFLIFLGLSLFIPNVSNMWLFYAIFIICWVAWTIIMIVKEKKKWTLKNFYHYEYPLVPVIAVSFYIWLVIPW